MKIWHQSFTVLEDLPAYSEAMRQHIAKVVRPDTEVVMHGQLPGTYPSNYPGSDIAISSLYHLHSLQWLVQAIRAQREGFDGYAMATLCNPLIREIRSVVDIPVIGYGEASMHVACMLAQNFGILLFIDRMIPLYAEQIATYGLSSRCVGIRPANFTFNDVLTGFENPQYVIERFHESARAMIKEGAEAIIPGEMPMNILLAKNGVTSIDGVPIIDGLAVTMKLTETFADLRRSVGMKQSRHGFFGAAPDSARLSQVLAFYGLDKLTGM